MRGTGADRKKLAELADEEEFYLRIYITRGEREKERYVKSERYTMDLPLSVSPSSNIIMDVRVHMRTATPLFPRSRALPAPPR